MRRPKRFITAVATILVAVSFVSTSLGVSSSVAQSIISSYGTINGQLSFLHVDGNLLRNEQGEVVYLRGVNKMSMEFTADPDVGAYNVRKADFENIRNVLGANVVRIDLALSLLFPTFDDQSPDATYLGHMDNIATWCRDLNMYVLFNLHGYYPQMGAPEDFWDSQGLGIRQPYRNDIRDFWVFIANRYKDNPAVFGFDLYGEPWNAVPSVDRPGSSEWKTQVEEWINAITDVNPKLIFVIENAGHLMWGFDDWRWLLTDPINGTNIVYSPHFYPQHANGSWKDYTWIGISGNTFANEYSGHNYAVAKSEMETFLAALYVQAENYPLLIGELGSSNDEAGLQFLRDFLGFCNGNGWSWIYWAWVGRAQPSYYLVQEDWVTLTPQGNVVKGYT